MQFAKTVMREMGFGVVAAALLYAPAHATVIEQDVFPGLGVSFLLGTPSGDETVNLTGSMQINVTLGSVDGAASDSNGNGRDDVPTEIVSLSLSGSSSLGPLSVGLRAGTPSLGGIEETANNNAGTLDIAPFEPTGTADSFFDVFFEIVIGGTTLHNVAPAHIATVIDHKPGALSDIEAMLGSFSPVGLFDDNDNSTGFTVAGAGRFQPVPEPATTALFGLGLVGIGFAARRRKRH